MNKIGKCLLCILIVCLTLPSAVYADYFCDFESGADDWICTPSGFTYDDNGAIMKGVDVVSDPENAGNNVLLISGTPGRASARIDFEDMHGKIEINFKVRFEDMDTNVFNFAGVSSADGLVITPMVHMGYFIYTDSAGNLVYSPGASSGKWLDIKYEIDTGSLRYSAYLKNNYSWKTLASNYPLGEQAIYGIRSFSSTANDVRIYIDDVEIKKVGESDAESYIWMYSKEYQIDHSSGTVGNVRYKTPKSVLYNSIKTRPDITMEISGEGEYIMGGEILTLKNSKTGGELPYYINVRTDSMTKLYEKVLNDYKGAFPPYFKDAFLIK